MVQLNCGLVSERDKWFAEYQAGSKPFLAAYNEYIKNRNSESWRMAKSMEAFFEYVRYLEQK